MKRNTLSQNLGSSSKIMDIQSEATKNVHRVRDPKYQNSEKCLDGMVQSGENFVAICKCLQLTCCFSSIDYMSIETLKRLYSFQVILIFFIFEKERWGMVDEMLMQKAAITWEYFVAKLGNDPIKVEEYKNFKISNGWLEKFKSNNTIAR